MARRNEGLVYRTRAREMGRAWQAERDLKTRIRKQRVEEAKTERSWWEGLGRGEFQAEAARRFKEAERVVEAERVEQVEGDDDGA